MDEDDLEGGPLGEGGAEEALAEVGARQGAPLGAGGFQEEEMLDVLAQRLGGEPAAGTGFQALEESAGAVGGVFQEGAEGPPEVDFRRLGRQHVADEEEDAVVDLDQGGESGGLRRGRGEAGEISGSPRAATRPAWRSL